jgi:hypothetical protein
MIRIHELAHAWQLCSLVSSQQLVNLRNIVQRHNARLAAHPQEATHLVVPDTDDMAYDDNAEYCRTIEIKVACTAFVRVLGVCVCVPL